MMERVMLDFEIKKRAISSERIRNPVRVLLLTDLHMAEHGPENADLIRAAGELHPDVLFIAGDLITGRPEYDKSTALRLLGALCRLGPVYYSYGNHESQLRLFPGAYRTYVRQVRGTGAILLNNRTVELTLGATPFSLTGLELPVEKFRKFRMPHLNGEELRELIGQGAEREVFTILLAHNPQFAKAYFAWGADLTLSGHFHGGLVRLGGNRVAMSPYGFPLPRYGYGHFVREGRHLIVSSGLGDHAMPCRIHNPMELVCIDLLPG